MGTHEGGVLAALCKMEWFAVLHGIRLVDLPGVHRIWNVLDIAAFSPSPHLLCWCSIRVWSSIAIPTLMRYGMSSALNLLQWR